MAGISIGGVVTAIAVKVRLVLCLCLLGLSGCATPPPRMVKIALVAPFEGRARDIGYAAFPAFRLALEAAAKRRAGSAVQITFVAYDDGADPRKAERIARNVAADPDVLAVIGHLTLTPTLAALHVYTEAGIAVLVPHLAPERLPQDALVFSIGPAQAKQTPGVRDAPEPSALPAAQTALVRFAELSLGPPPGPGAIVAYDATNVLIAALEADLAANSGQPTRAGVATALRSVRHAGLLGTIQFDARGRWPDAPVFPR